MIASTTDFITPLVWGALGSIGAIALFLSGIYIGVACMVWYVLPRD